MSGQRLHLGYSLVRRKLFELGRDLARRLAGGEALEQRPLALLPGALSAGHWLARLR
jgi:hypothetical protein